LTTAYVYDPIYLEHDLPSHPENARRLQRILEVLQGEGLLERLTRLEPRPATDAELERVHTPEHVARVRQVAQSGGGNFDSDTYVAPRSYDAALMAASGLVRAVEAVLAGEIDNGFALVRPPGHHATPSRSMGFCLFNNVAVAARAALAAGGVEPFAVLEEESTRPLSRHGATGSR
jgi:acetoin utilization deacetylase AcuC-like enzyme